MITEGSIAGRQVFDDLNTQYEDAYKNNPFKKACVQKAIGLLKPGSRVLDVGCGTGIPVTQMLVDAGMDVVGTDIAPLMVEAAKQRVPGATFTVADMVEYSPNDTFDAIFVIYSHMQLAYNHLHSMLHRLASALAPGGLLAIGTSPVDHGSVPADNPAWDESRSYMEDHVLMFWGEPMKHTVLSREGNLKLLTSMGLEIVYETYNVFQPENAKCSPEHQLYFIGRRVDNQALKLPKPLPKAA